LVSNALGGGEGEDSPKKKVSVKPFVAKMFAAEMLKGKARRTT